MCMGPHWSVCSFWICSQGQVIVALPAVLVRLPQHGRVVHMVLQNSAAQQACNTLTCCLCSFRYGFSRLCSYVFIPTMQLMLLNQHGYVGAAIVTALSEAAGASLQMWLVRCACSAAAWVYMPPAVQHSVRGHWPMGHTGGLDLHIRTILARRVPWMSGSWAAHRQPCCACSTAVAPLTQLSSYESFNTLARAINAVPFIFSALAHVSGFQLYAPYLVAVGTLQADHDSQPRCLISQPIGVCACVL